jgi:hypothetical protein
MEDNLLQIFKEEISEQARDEVAHSNSNSISENIVVFSR